MEKNAKYIVIVAVIMVLCLGLVLFVNNNKDKGPVETESSVEEETGKAEETGNENGDEEASNDNSNSGEAQKFSTLKAAVDLGLPFKCTYKVDGNEMEGYIKGKQYKGSISTADGKKGEVIRKDECLWSWEVGSNQGAKMCFEATEDQESIWDNPAGGEGVEYFCTPAIVTDSMFTPPTSVQFMDLSQMMTQPVEE